MVSTFGRAEIHACRVHLRLHVSWNDGGRIRNNWSIGGRKRRNKEKFGLSYGWACSTSKDKTEYSATTFKPLNGSQWPRNRASRTRRSVSVRCTNTAKAFRRTIIWRHIGTAKLLTTSRTWVVPEQG